MQGAISCRWKAVNLTEIQTFLTSSTNTRGEVLANLDFLPRRYALVNRVSSARKCSFEASV